MSNLTTNTLTSLSGNSVNVNDIANGNVGIGVGQTWQDVKGERAFGIEYTNDTGRPIMVSASVTNNLSSGWVDISCFVDGIRADWQSAVGTSNMYPRAKSTIVVPAGSTYNVNVQSDDPVSIAQWAELR
jgi:hypothetical protein